MTDDAMAATGKRFVTFSENGYADFLKRMVSKNTESSTKTAVNLFRTFCEEETDWMGNVFKKDNIFRR